MGFLISQSVSMNDPTKISQDYGSIGYSGDSDSHTWSVSVNNADTFLTGKTASVLFILPSGIKVIQSAAISGTNVSITFGQAVYAEAGQVVAFMQIVDSTAGTTTTVATLRFIVTDCASGEIHVPDDIVLPIKDLMKKYTELNTAYGQLALNASKIADISGALTVLNTKTSAASGYTLEATSVSNIVMEYGEIESASIASGEYRDVVITFTKTFPDAPIVMLTLASTSTAGSHGRVSAGITNAPTSTGVTARIWNGDSIARSPRLAWVAIYCGY